MFKDKYLDKTIRIWKRDGMKFEGKFLEENELGLWIDDIKVGEKFIAFSEISEIEEVGE